MAGRLQGRVAIVTGGSRGIGRECVLALAREGCNVVVAAKSITDTPNLPGTIHSVAAEAEKLGVEALASQVDLRDVASIEACVENTVARFGRIDILVNNASALWWQTVEDTPQKRFDLIMAINARGSFAMTRACLPHMARRKHGRVITMSPPISGDYRVYAGKTAYFMSKFSMSMVAMGAAAEGEGRGITGNALWPATVIESFAAKNFDLGEKSQWRKAAILADCVVALALEDDAFTGQMLIDDEYLRSKGRTDADLAKYRYDPDVEPRRILALEGEWGGDFKRGDVAKLQEDKARSSRL